jgi:FMN phosphatase YigB (HAD superfamily)
MPNGSPSTAVFFDIGDTLATARVSAEGRLERLVVLTGVPEVLAGLREAGQRLGILSNTGVETAADMERVLVDCGLYAAFDPGLLLYSAEEGIDKSDPEIFRRACARAGLADDPSGCWFVGESEAERARAAGVGMRVAATPQIVLELLGEDP